MLNKVQKLQLHYNSHFLAMVSHTFTNDSLNAIKSPILKLLARILILKGLHTTRDQTLKLRKIVPVDKLSKYIKGVLNFFLCKELSISQYNI